MDTIADQGKKIHDALNLSSGRDKKLIDIMKNKYNDRDNRIQIRKYYDKMYQERGLLDDFNKKLGGDFKNIMAELFLSRAEYDADQLDRALTGLSKDENCVYEIFFSRPIKLLSRIEDVYKEITNRDLRDDIKKNYKGGIKDSLLYALDHGRNEEERPDKDTCEEYAQKLMDAKANTWIDNKDIMENIFLTISPEELVLTCRFYLKKTSTHIRKAIDSMSRANKNFFSSLLFAVISPTEMYARKLNEAIKGLGTDTNLLERCLVNRHDMDMDIIKKFYNRIYKTTLKADVIGDTSGCYRDICMHLVNYMGDEDY